MNDEQLTALARCLYATFCQGESAFQERTLWDKATPEVHDYWRKCAITAAREIEQEKKPNQISTDDQLINEQNTFAIEIADRVHTWVTEPNNSICASSEGRVAFMNAAAMVRAQADSIKRLHEQVKAVKNKTIKDVAKWICSAVVSGMFGSETFYIRKRLSEIISSGEWETIFKNEEMRP